MEEQPQLLKRVRLDPDDSRADIASDNGIAPVRPPSQLQPESQQFFTRDEKYWFEDGNIILSARNVGFKVYKGLLAEHSAVFRGMFVVAQGAHTAGEQADGCPVVPLDDSPDDLRELFRIIYPLTSNVSLDRGTVDMDMLSAVIRLDHKYELPALQPKAMGFLTTYYTSRFRSWVNGTHALQWKPQPLDAISAIAIARLTHTPSILPTAFYELCTLKASQVLRGRPRKDGCFEKLSENDVELYLGLRDTFAYYNIHSAFRLFRTQSKDCIYGSDPASACAIYLRGVLDQSGLSNLPHLVSSLRALDSWLKNVTEYKPPKDNLTPPGLCRHCKSYIETRDIDLRYQIWGLLPDAVGVTIEGWDAGS